MICGDLDLERAKRDTGYRRSLGGFLVMGMRSPLFAVGFPELRQANFQLRRLAEKIRPAKPRRRQANAG